MAVKLELYRVFKEVADTGNISSAADSSLQPHRHIERRSAMMPIKNRFIPLPPFYFFFFSFHFNGSTSLPSSISFAQPVIRKR